MTRRRLMSFGVATFTMLFALALFPPPASSQQVDPAVFSGMRWRLIGPFRGGRALTAVGVPGQPSVFYFGAVGGGVWKTVNAGRTWEPIFDHEPIASIGAVAVAPSDPNIIYVGSGEADMRSDISYGNGMYKSTDAGKTWLHIGLKDSEQIGRILVDPHDPNIVFVAAPGHGYGPNNERGVFRSKDGGNSWQRVLFKDANTGAIDLAFDPSNSKIIYAALWQTRRPPWSIYPPSSGPGTGLYKSTDGGDTWNQLSGNGLPSEGLGRIGIAVAPSNPDRVYLIVDAKEGGVYRSDDAGATWQRMDAEQRIWGRGWYFGGVTVDPKDADTVYVMNTSTYRSRDGGKSFEAIKGAPGGDDYHSLWVDPNNPDRMILSSDQGVVISEDGAQTWSSWYNQPTAQFYHVITVNRFPFWICGAQQDSGAACIASRSPYSTISFGDWRPVAVGGESGYIASDPLDPNIFYGGSFGSAVVRYDWRTHSTQGIPPSLAHPDDYRSDWTLPVVFSTLDPHQLYYGTQVLFRTSNGGQSWQIISPDLTREDPGVPPNLDAPTAADAPKGKRRGVIYTIAPSPLRAGEIWVGTDDGLIQVTRDDGKNWQNVTPPSLTAWSKIGLIEASRHDPNKVYAAVDRHRLDDFAPHIFRTEDGGKTWQEIVRGIPDGSYVNAVREDPVKAGLLYAGTETGVFVSFNDGDDWQPLQLNLPNASIRDLAIKDDDLIVATHGRSFWILDDITPLRQTDAVAGYAAYLFKPRAAIRLRPASFEGTPLPLDEPQGQNPPNGAILDYYLKSPASEPVTLEILDSAGKVVRQYSSADKVPQIDPRKLNIPMYWIHPPKPLSAEAGMHRIEWDMHYPGAGPTGNPMAALFGFGGGPWAPPGNYTVKLTVDGRAYTEPLTLEMDPRTKVSTADMVKQFEMAERIVAEIGRISAASAEGNKLVSELNPLSAKPEVKGELADEVARVLRDTIGVMGATPTPNPAFTGVSEATSDRTSLRYWRGELATLESVIESADTAPTSDAETAFALNQEGASKGLARWDQIKTRDLPHLNEDLRQAGLPALSEVR